MNIHKVDILRVKLEQKVTEESQVYEGIREIRETEVLKDYKVLLVNLANL